MKKIFKIKVIVFTLILLVSLCTVSSAQNKGLKLLQDISMQVYFDAIANEDKDYSKEKINNEILEKFRELLNKEDSFENRLDSLKNIGVLYSPDQQVRIITWNLPYNDGTHKYFGFIQYKKSKRQTLTFELKDQSEKIEQPENKILNSDMWFGALYYKIIENKYKGEKYYTLLGADLNDMLTHKKIVEVLYFDTNDSPVFGKPVFKNQRSSVHRVIFEFSAQSKMVLTFDEEKQMIVYDHLSPVRPSLVGRYEFYGPDFTHDGLKFERGIWNVYQDIDVRNYDID